MVFKIINEKSIYSHLIASIMKAEPVKAYARNKQCVCVCYLNI